MHQRRAAGLLHRRCFMLRIGLRAYQSMSGDFFLHLPCARIVAAIAA